MEVAVLDQSKNEVGKIELNEKIFSVEYNNHIVFESLINEQANKRQGTHFTKNRSEVVGSGKKPWRQKGTGRARSGTRKSPIWKGGGVCFGPKPRDYSYKMPKKMKRKAYKSVLSKRLKENVISFVKLPDFQEGKTKIAYSFLKDLGFDSKRTVIIFKDENPMLKRAFNNIPNVETLSHKRLNIKDLYYAERIVIADEAAKEINDFFEKIIRGNIMNLNNIVLRPILTEKSNFERENGHFVFLVKKEANKIQIRDALELLYQVTTKSIRIINVKRKIKTYNYKKGVKPGYKKAMVRLAPGSEFKFFEGV